MRSLPPHRRAAALIASLSAIIASSGALMVSTHGHGAGVYATQFGLGLALGLSGVLMVAVFLKQRTR